MTLTKPAAYVPVALETLEDADHQSGLHETDRTTIRDIIDKLGEGNSTPAADEALIASSDMTSVWDVHARRNLLVNGDFRLWQMGTTPSPTPTDNLYGPDQWRLLLEAASAAAIVQETSDLPSDGGPAACRLTVGSGEDNKFGIWQPIEYQNVKHLRGKVVSLQAKIKATAAITDVRMAVMEWTGTPDAITADPINNGTASMGASGTNPTLTTNWAYLGTPVNLSPTTSWATYRVENLAVGSSANNLAVFIWCEDETTTVTTDILRITDVQLEEGKVCTGFDRRPYGEETALAQWFYRRMTSGGSNTLVAQASAIGTASVVVFLQLGAFMRAAPTLTVANTAINVPNADLSNGTATGTIGSHVTTRFSVQFTISSISSAALTAGQSLLARWNGASEYLELSARL